MISSIKTSIPRRFENLKRMVLPFVVEVADGQLASFVIPNNSGSIFADFTKAGATARKTTGPLDLTDGAANNVINVANATIEIEQGAPDPGQPWLILGAISVIGMEAGGEIWAGRSTGQVDETSLGFEFAKSSAGSLIGQLGELSKWVKG